MLSISTYFDYAQYKSLDGAGVEILVLSEVEILVLSEVEILVLSEVEILVLSEVEIQNPPPWVKNP
ncbi:hypothetical protein [Nostoc sp.]|uniref:hypothetical protein n=1 Tax=Nostoc sp. TaxID=1180 RepID=UPI002FF9752F